MYAVIQTGGKQYRVKEGDRLKIETLSHEIGAQFNFEQVLLMGEGESVLCGTPFINSAMVTATVLDHGRHKKIRIIKFRRRKHHMKQMGHRQNFTHIEINSISKPKK